MLIAAAHASQTGVEAYHIRGAPSLYCGSQLGYMEATPGLRLAHPVPGANDFQAMLAR